MTEFCSENGITTMITVLKYFYLSLIDFDNLWMQMDINYNHIDIEKLRKSMWCMNAKHVVEKQTLVQ